MRTLLSAATAPPTILLTTALVVLLCFWLLVVVGFTSAGSFDADANLRAWGIDGVPVSVALSALTAVAWSLSVGGVLLLAACAPPCPATSLLRMVWPVAALPVAWRLTCLFVRPLHRLFPDEPGPPDRGRARDHVDHPA
ncbi:MULTISPECIES: hypothetical protein [Streptomyces]|uniref:Uncharacterized protein n=1 Tax=Streptomyces chartreusis NRRL 3882 TaxID=1079985 RepID=A0A2N9BLX6_STRCX|nr:MULTISPECIES: hypothetical protein [Streptomyces]MYS92930.1 hypothetical protein [Streptomyces sp. SID5464]SOR84364.1 hypothetical protein SCNRRL3882_7809 [Streptomyces chartreusis NRRL 3882]